MGNTYFDYADQQITAHDMEAIRGKETQGKANPVIFLNKIIDLDLSIRSTNALMNAGIFCIGDLVGKTAEELKIIKGLGRKCVSEIGERLEELHLAPHSPDSPTELKNHVRAMPPEVERQEQQKYWKRIAGDIQTLEDEIFFFLRPAPSQRHKQIVMSVYGWDGKGKKTLGSVGRTFGLTRERIRQICVGSKQRLRRTLKQGGLQFTILERAMGYIVEHAPSDTDAIEAGLVGEGITRERFNLEGIQTLAEFLDRETRFTTVSIGCRTFAVRSDDMSYRTSCSAAIELSKRAIGHWGMANISDIAGQIKKRTGRVPSGDMVSTAITSLGGFQWLDESAGWFWSTSIPKNRLLNLIKKVLSIAGKIRVSELRAGIGRFHRMHGFSPPNRVLLELCRQLPWCRVEGTTIAADPPLDWEKTLDTTEWAICSVLKEHESVMPRVELEKECLGLGMNPRTFTSSLLYSPILSMPANSIYALRGTNVKPGSVDPARGRETAKER